LFLARLEHLAEQLAGHNRAGVGLDEPEEKHLGIVREVPW